MQAENIIRKLKAQSNPAAVQSTVRYGINPQNTLGISMPAVRAIAKEIGTDHPLAGELWASAIHEARILACLIDNPKAVTEEQLESWSAGFDSWDVCDQCCANLFDKTPFVYPKATEWSKRQEEFIKRAGFVLMAALVVHDKKTSNERFAPFLPLIKESAVDERNFVKKAVNWALRQIGKRNLALNAAAIHTVKEIQNISSGSARWIATDALRELAGSQVQDKFKRTLKSGG